MKIKTYDQEKTEKILDLLNNPYPGKVVHFDKIDDCMEKFSESVYKYEDFIPEDIVEKDKEILSLLEIIIFRLEEIQNHHEERLLLNQEFLLRFLRAEVERVSGFIFRDKP